MAATYPTRSLEFLQELESKETCGLGDDDGSAFTWHAKPAVRAKVVLNVVVVGAGLGGLAASIALARRGHSVTVLEQAAQLGEVGAGIQIPPNSSRLLLQWGLEPFLKEHVVEPAGMSFRRWENGAVIGHTKLIPEFRRSFKAPYYVVHRAHFHDALLRRAVDLGVDVRLASKVVSYDADTPAVFLQDGRSFSADLVVAVDGVKSLARESVLGGLDKAPRATGFAAYRATVDAERMKADPDVSWLLTRPGLNIWIGEDRHVMTYTIASGKSFNMVLSHVDRSDPSTWNQDTVIQDMRRYFAGWDPQLTKVINMIDKALKWPLLSGSPLDHWVAPSGKLLIIGDAAHAMVPYMSQGAAMAVEDGAALAEALSLVDSPDGIPTALHVFEQERMKRARQMQDASLVNGKLWHFADGPEQKARDMAMRAEVEGEHFIASPNQWSDPVTQWWAYGYDAQLAVRKLWEENRGRLNTRRPFEYRASRL